MVFNFGGFTNNNLIRIILAGILIIFLCGCVGPKPVSSSNLKIPLVVKTLEISLTQTAVSLPTATPTPEPTNTLTPTPEPTSTLTPTPILPTPTATWAVLPPGKVTMPVLLYHHISDDPKFSAYGVDVESFRQEMESLKARGYQTLPLSALVSTIRVGGAMPERPIAITFDDGDLDVYENAFPIMQSLGFTGTIFVVTKYIDAPGFMSTSQITELLQAGWELGSHGRSHIDLTKTSDAESEITFSKSHLEQKFNTTVNFIAYPYGEINPDIIRMTIDARYQGGAGLGTRWEHMPYDVYYINRIEIKHGTPLEKFNAMLPW